VQLNAPAEQITTILFDADGVMQRTETGWQDELVALLGDRAEVEGEHLVAAIQRAEAPTMGGVVDFDESMTKVLEEFSLPADVDDVLDLWTRIIPDPSMLAAVQDLREAGVLCCLATNQQPRRASWMQRHLRYGEAFDRQFYSCELGLAKPDPAYFTTILTEVDRAPAQVLFVDDTPVNITGARSVGLHAHLFPRHAGRPGLEEILRGYAVVGR